MMVQDTSPPPRPRISKETLATLREALDRYVRGEFVDGDLDGAMTRLSSEARQRGVPPEEVLVELKSVWSTLSPGTARGVERSESALLQRVVTLCIKSYYR